LVWQNLDSFLTGVKTVYYSPVGELNKVSFSALCFQSGDSLYAYNEKSKRGIEIESSDSQKQTCGNYLLDKYTLHQLTTTKYLADSTLIKQKPLTSTIELIGGINYDSIPNSVNTILSEQTNEDVSLEINLQNEISKRNIENTGKMLFLEGTKTEVSRIGSILSKSKWKVSTYTEKDAGEFKFKKKLSNTSPGILHIATHGFSLREEEKKTSNINLQDANNYYKVSEDPMVRCGLMMSGSNISWTGNPKKMINETGDDGILTAAEVANMNLSNTKLVVLSACETGLGKIEGTEGTLGLKRGFKLAGVEQIIVSLWSVPDNETMELMTSFYNDLAKTKDPVVSFEKAQKEMRNKYPFEPEKWAGFVLVR
jgi:CHAT domain-containing protein